MTDASPSAKRLKVLRERADVSRAEIGGKIGKPETSYQYYEEKFKKEYLPIDLITAIAPHLMGLGNPPITEEEILALGGITGRSTFVSHSSADKAVVVGVIDAIKERATSSQRRMLVRDLAPGQSYTTNDPDELALLDEWQRLSRTKKAAWFERLERDLPSLAPEG